MDLFSFETTLNTSDTSYFVTEHTDFANVTSRSNNTSSNHTIQDRYTYCFSSLCILNAIVISIISISGIITNMIVMIVVKIDKRLHQPTFVAIAALALPDLTFLVARYTRYIIDGYFALSMSRIDYRITKVVFDFIGLIAGGASIFNVIMLSVLRYYIIVHPLMTHAKLTIKMVMLISFALWVVAIGNGSFYLYAVIINTSDRILQRITNQVVTLFMSIFPVVVICILHVLKTRALSKSPSITEETVRKMSRVIAFVICSYLITTTPSNLLDIATIVLSKEYTNTRLFYGLSQAGRVFLFLNYAINPFIYFVFSPQFKRFFLGKCSCIRPAVERSSNYNMVSDSNSVLSTQLTEVSKTYMTINKK